MKHDKIRYYLDETIKRRGKPTIYDAWMLNLFACKVPGRKEHVYVQTDPRGITSKCADFVVRMPKRSRVILETVAVLQDYVQHLGDDRHAPLPGANEPPDNLQHDEANIDIEIPTEHVEFIVVLDEELYRDDERFSGNLKPELRFSLKNMRGAPFADGVLPTRKVGYDRGLVKMSHVPFEEHDDKGDAREVHTRVDTLKATLDAYGNRAKSAPDEPHLKRFQDDLGKLKAKPRPVPYVPKRGVLLRLDFARCTMGLRLAINWLKPMRG